MAELKIEGLGREGDGFAKFKGQPVHIPFSLPGETVSAVQTGKSWRLDKIHNSSPDRVDAPCPHFGSCGGCQMQHMAEGPYKIWKLDLVARALSQQGIDVDVEGPVTFPVDTRRKVTFQVSSIDKKVALGFSKQGSHQIVPITTCSILHPVILEKLDDLKKLAEPVVTKNSNLRMAVLMTEEGLDVELSGLKAVSEEQRSQLARRVVELGILRLSLEDEVLLEPIKAIVYLGDTAVVPPPGAFVQAVKQAEDAMVSLVCEHLKSCKSVADLFCGIGTFALNLAKNSTVLAVEENNAALESLDRGWRETGGKLKQIKTEARNLDRRPVTFAELKKIAGVVFDPPRAGAELQARQIAKSKAVKVAAVSCNPITLARDLRILLDGGYKLKRVIAIDQFRYTPHVEVVALLER